MSEFRGVIRRFSISGMLLLSILGYQAAAASKDKRIVVTIVSTNDVHGKYFDSLYVRNESNPTSYANVSSFVNNLRSEGKDPVLIDVGDNLQGDNAAYYFNNVDTAEVHILPRVLNYLKYDAVVVGNHDVEAGHRVYDRVRKELNCSYLAANAIKPDGNPYFDSYAILQRNGLKIAVIGFTNPNIASWIAPNLYSGMKFDSIPRLAQLYIDSINVWEKPKPDVMIVAVHSGTGVGDGTDFENVGLDCARRLHGVDVVLCSHDHKAYSELVDGADGHRVLLMNAGKQASYIGLGTVAVTLGNDKSISKTVDGHIIPMAYVPVDKEYAEHFRSDFLKVKEFTNKNIGVITQPINCNAAILGPSSYVHLLQTVMMETTGADISMCAPISSATVPAGPINIQDLFTLYPYENQLYVVKMTGEQVKNMLEMSYNFWITGAGPTFNYDSAEGIIYEVSRTAPFGQRVVIKSMQDGSPFNLQKTYLVAMTSYRASGGGDLLRKGAGIDPTGIDAIVVGRYPEIRNLLYEYVQRHQIIEPVSGNNWKFLN